MKRDLTQYALLRVEHSAFHEGQPVTYLTMPSTCGPSNPNGVIRALDANEPIDRDILWQLEREEATEKQHGKRYQETSRTLTPRRLLGSACDTKS